MRREINIRAPADADRICDFCGDAPVYFTYPAKDIEYPEERYASVGDWCACRTCHEMIGRDDRRGLAERCAEMFASRHPVEAGEFSRERLLTEAARIHHTFFDARVRTG